MGKKHTEIKQDAFERAGVVLIVIGVGMWGVYAVGKYLLGWDITDRDFLPWHLLVILPGMALKFHKDLTGFLRRMFRRGGTE